MTTLKIKKSTTNKIHKIATKWLAAERAYDKKVCDEIGIPYRDSFADTKVAATDRGSVVITYDGAGYDVLACDADGHPADWEIGPRARLRTLLGSEFIIEDANSWSYAIWPDYY